jgi:hypothetical protein
LPDGTSGFELNQARLDRIIAKYFQDEKIREEGLALEVVNATNHSGLAARAARIISNMGGRVIAMRDWDLRNEKCSLRSGQKNLSSYTLKKLVKVFDCQFDGEDLGSSRAEMIIILGEDYWRELNKK